MIAAEKTRLAADREWLAATQTMTLGNMRANGVRSLSVSCWQCHHSVVLCADRWPDGLYMTLFDSWMVCTSCGIIGADVRPNWAERPERPSLTGTQWRRD